MNRRSKQVSRFCVRGSWFDYSYTTRAPVYTSKLRANSSFYTTIRLLQPFSEQKSSFDTIIGNYQTFIVQKTRVTGRNRRLRSVVEVKYDPYRYLYEASQQLCLLE